MEGAAGKEESGRRPAAADRLTMRYRERYSRLDRLLHRLAFSSFEVQKALADIEDRLCARRLVGIEIDRPVFITALPRAGTTLLLETLDSLDLFATHTYRNMPFLLVPLFWNAVTLPFRAPHVAVERAHGDGMTIGFDSPEAFEEVVWRAFWQSSVEQLADRPLEQHVAVVEQHLAVPPEAERLEGMERGQRMIPARIRGREARHPVEQRGPNRLEAHGPAHRREDRARRLGQAVVEDDDVAGEPGMVRPERAEHDDGARHERVRDHGGETHVPGAGARQGTCQVTALRGDVGVHTEY